MVAVNVPVDDVVTVAGVVASEVVSNFIVMVLLALKPEPETVTVVPPVPALGESVSVPNVPILNVAEPVLPVASVAVIV